MARKILLGFLCVIGFAINGMSQCSYDNVLFGDLTPLTPGSTQTEFSGSGGDLYTISVQAGETYIFSTCNSLLGFDTQLTLYDATGTNVLGYNDDACAPFSNITWTATFTGVVHLLLDEYDCINSGTDAQVDVTWVIPAPNDNCADVTPAILVNGVAQTFNGSTNGGTMSIDESSVFGYAMVWEAVTLTGVCNNLTIDFCGSDPGVMDGVYDAYSDCPITGSTFSDNFTYSYCADGNHLYSFYNLPAGTYYLPVVADLGYNSVLGNYVMNVISEDCPPPPVNDDCADAIPVNCGDVINGYTFSSNDDLSAPFCGDGQSGGIWYTFTGTGQAWTISLCGSSFDTYLSIYSGTDCNNLSCEDFNDDGNNCSNNTSEIEDFPTVAGTTYYILVNAYSSSGYGNVVLTLSSELPDNDDCVNAIAIMPGITSGTTSCASVDTAVSCGSSTAPTAPGIWYTYTTFCNSNVTASLCAGTSYNSQISIFDGTCGSLNCIAGNDDACATQSEITWTPVAGTTYYILVHGFGTEAGDFSLNLSQDDNVAPVADVAPLPDMNGSCNVVVTAPTATDNCTGILTGTTSDPVSYYVPGNYTVTWTYDDGNGNTTTQTQNVIVAPDLIPPTIICMNDTTISSSADSCGAVFSFSMPQVTDNCGSNYIGTDVYYLRSNTSSEPWGYNTNITSMDAVFGSGLWIDEYFETVNVVNAFSTSTKFIFLEGSDSHADELNAFLQSNQSAIETYVNNGGTLLINSAPNEGGDIDFGFGGIMLNYNSAQPDVNAVNPTDPIFNGPFTPCGTAFSGNDFSHSHITGPGITPIIEGGGVYPLVSKPWGSGFVVFGGMTMPDFHSPQPNAFNLRQNIFSWIADQSGANDPSNPTIAQVSGLSSGSLFPLGVTQNVFVATDGGGNTDTCIVEITVVDNTPPAIPSNNYVLNIYYGSDYLDEAEWQVVDATNTVFASGGLYPNMEFPGYLAETVDLTGAVAPLTFIGETQGTWGDNILIYEFICGANVLVLDTIDQSTIDSTNNIAGCSISLSDVVSSCPIDLTGSEPTLEDVCAGTIVGTTTTMQFDQNGTYTVTWTFNDGNGNTTTQTQQVTISDNNYPMPTSALPPITGNCSVTVSTVPTAQDSCSGMINGVTSDPLIYNTVGTYIITWTYTDEVGNSTQQPQTIIVNPCLGIEDEAGEWNVLIYPNPSSGVFTLSFAELPNENTEIKLVNNLGQVLYSGRAQAQIQQYDFSYLASGSYHLLIQTDTRHISKPIIIRQNY